MNSLSELTQARHLPVLGSVGLLLTYLLLKWHLHRSQPSKVTTQTLPPRDNSQPFETPLPDPLTDFDPKSNLPKLYRPFRRGPNFITMGIRKLHWNNWIEMDSYFMRYHDMKAAELKKDRDAHVKYVDNAVTKDACFELYEELVKYLTHRYPKIFRLEGRTLHNTLTHEQFEYPASMSFISSRSCQVAAYKTSVMLTTVT